MEERTISVKKLSVVVDDCTFLLSTQPFVANEIVFLPVRRDEYSSKMVDIRETGNSLGLEYT